jgi:hypothetical protein
MWLNVFNLDSYAIEWLLVKITRCVMCHGIVQVLQKSFCDLIMNCMEY